MNQALRAQALPPPASWVSGLRVPTDSLLGPPRNVTERPGRGADVFPKLPEERAPCPSGPRSTPRPSPHLGETQGGRRHRSLPSESHLNAPSTTPPCLPGSMEIKPVSAQPHGASCSLRKAQHLDSAAAAVHPGTSFLGARLTQLRPPPASRGLVCPSPALLGPRRIHSSPVAPHLRPQLISSGSCEKQRLRKCSRRQGGKDAQDAAAKASKERKTGLQNAHGAGKETCSGLAKVPSQDV